jgi:hypothetical protein
MFIRIGFGKFKIELGNKRKDSDRRNPGEISDDDKNRRTHSERRDEQEIKKNPPEIL